MKLKVCVGLLLFSCGVPLMTGDTRGVSEPPKQIRKSVEELGSEDYRVSNRAFQALFSAGKNAIPFLIEAFSDERSYNGFCGLSSYRSSDESTISLDELMQPTEDRSLALQTGRRPNGLREVRSTALYLLVAILTGERYFAESCTLHYAEGSLESVSLALSDVRLVWAETPAEKLLEEVVSILEKHDLRFDGARLVGRGKSSSSS